MPTTDLPEADPMLHGDQLVFIDDDISRLRGRITRLQSRHAHREYPWSRTRRLITNVRITEVGFSMSWTRVGAPAATIGIYFQDRHLSTLALLNP